MYIYMHAHTRAHTHTCVAKVLKHVSLFVDGSPNVTDEEIEEQEWRMINVSLSIGE